MADLTALQAAVAANTDVINSARTLIQGLAAQIQANITDPIALSQLVNQLRSSDADLASAVVANTSAPPPAPTGPLGVTPTTVAPTTVAPMPPVQQVPVAGLAPPDGSLAGTVVAAAPAPVTVPPTVTTAPPAVTVNPSTRPAST
jgi:hypothetical protein